MISHLCAVVPEADAVLGSAESIPLVDASADVVTVAQAFHWFDQESALAEIARVLRPGGRLALVWNTRDDHQAWVAELSRIIGSECSHDWGLDRFLSLGGSFGQVEKATFSFVQRIDRSTLADLVLSRSYCAVLSEEDRRPVIAAVDALFDERSEGGVIALPYVTVCFRAARR